MIAESILSRFPVFSFVCLFQFLLCLLLAGLFLIGHVWDTIWFMIVEAGIRIVLWPISSGCVGTRDQGLSNKMLWSLHCLYLVLILCSLLYVLRLRKENPTCPKGISMWFYSMVSALRCNVTSSPRQEMFSILWWHMQAWWNIPTSVWLTWKVLRQLILVY